MDVLCLLTVLCGVVASLENVNGRGLGQSHLPGTGEKQSHDDSPWHGIAASQGQQRQHHSARSAPRVRHKRAVSYIFDVESVKPADPAASGQEGFVKCSVDATPPLQVVNAYFGRYYRQKPSTRVVLIHSLQSPERDRYSISVISNSLSEWKLTLSIRLDVADNNYTYDCAASSGGNASLTWSGQNATFNVSTATAPTQPAMPPTSGSMSPQAATNIGTTPNSPSLAATGTASSSQAIANAVTSASVGITSVTSASASAAASSPPGTVNALASMGGNGSNVPVTEGRGEEDASSSDNLLIMAYVGAPVLVVACVYAAALVKRNVNRSQSHDISLEGAHESDVRRYVQDHNMSGWPANFTEQQQHGIVRSGNGGDGGDGGAGGVGDGGGGGGRKGDTIYDESVLPGAQCKTPRLTRRPSTFQKWQENGDATPRVVVSEAGVPDDDTFDNNTVDDDDDEPYEEQQTAFTWQPGIGGSNLTPSAEQSECGGSLSRTWSMSSCASFAEDELAKAGWELPDEDEHSLGDALDDVDSQSENATSRARDQKRTPIPYPDNIVYEELVHAKKFKSLAGKTGQPAESSVAAKEETGSPVNVQPTTNFTVYDEVDPQFLENVRKTMSKSRKSKKEDREAAKDKNRDATTPNLPAAKRHYSISKKLMPKVGRQGGHVGSGTDKRLLHSSLSTTSAATSSLHVEPCESMLTMCEGPGEKCASPVSPARSRATLSIDQNRSSQLSSQSSGDEMNAGGDSYLRSKSDSDLAPITTYNF